MNTTTRHFGLLLFLCSSIVGATPPSSDTAKRTQLAEQKARLVETLINTPAMKAAPESNNPEVATSANTSRLLLEQARSALKAEQPEEAIDKLDEALRSLSRASSMLANDVNGTTAAQKRQFDEYASQIESYRRSLQEIISPPHAASAARELISKLDAMTSEGRRLNESEKTEEAGKRMAAAYKLAVEEISRLRDGQEVVMRLNFATPREEFVYEQKRFHSNEILVSMMSKEERTGPNTRKQVEAFVSLAVDLKNEANLKANSNDYPAAIKDMEKAVLHLNRALQLMGVPVF